MCVHFFNFDHLRFILQSSDLIWGIKFRAPSLLLPSLIFSYLQALIHGFLWWWASSWLIFSLKWRLQSYFFLLHFAAIELQEAKDSIDEENPRPTSSTWSYVTRFESTQARSTPAPVSPNSRWSCQLSPRTRGREAPTPYLFYQPHAPWRREVLPNDRKGGTSTHHLGMTT